MIMGILGSGPEHAAVKGVLQVVELGSEVEPQKNKNWHSSREPPNVWAHCGHLTEDKAFGKLAELGVTGR